MKNVLEQYPFRVTFSLNPLIDYWRAQFPLTDAEKGEAPKDLRECLQTVSALKGPAGTIAGSDSCTEEIQRLVTMAFPAAVWETEMVGAFRPFSLDSFWVSPLFREMLLTESGEFRGHSRFRLEEVEKAIVTRAYYLILSRLYDIDLEIDFPLIQVVKDAHTGLDRYFRFWPNFRFLDVKNIGGPEKLTDEEREEILENISDPDRLREILRPEDYAFDGFSIIQATDVTEQEALSRIEKLLAKKDTLFSATGFGTVLQHLRSLFRKSELTAGIGAIQGDQVLMLTKGCDQAYCCIFGDTSHVPISEFKGSIFERTVQSRSIVRAKDLSQAPDLTRSEQEMVSTGLRSVMVIPLAEDGEVLGTLKLASPAAGDFGPRESMLAEKIAQPFSNALRRSLDDFHNNIQRIIKERCTAVHPSVEWRFQKAVIDHLERLHRGESSEIEPIVFKGVRSLYGSADVRGSSDARNRAIRADLTEHLDLSLHVIKTASEDMGMPILRELAHRIGEHKESLDRGIGTGDEMTVMSFLRTEVETIFTALNGLSPRVAEAIAVYNEAMDPERRTIYRKRRDFEQSVNELNQRLSNYLDSKQAEAQAVYPHYFDKHKTDGISYVIYIGDEMVEGESFHDLHVRNLRLWQLMVACGMARISEEVKTTVKTPLDVTHLILVSHSPLSIRFRFDEKRFDVDGAYNTGHEIIRSRIDKAMVKGRSERLTQPGQIAVVYSRPEEAREMLRHIEYLRSMDLLKGDAEHLELEDLPDVQGLRALRVEVNQEAVGVSQPTSETEQAEAVA